MSETTAQAASPLPEIGHTSVYELWLCLRRGADDFRAAPAFGLFFSGVLVIVGFAMLWLSAGHVAWVLFLSLGFPLAAPFLAVGLYEVSRRLEADIPLVWAEILGVVWQERRRQIPWVGWVILFTFLVWTFLAHMIFALFMGVSTMTNVMSDWSIFWTGAGLRMIAVELVVGGAIAFFLFAATVVSLPLLLDREVDFVTAMILSIRAVRTNLLVMLLWAVLIAGLTFLALLPWFLGLLVVFPVIGHATWHIYRHTLYDEA